jgi:transglutaminase-like putative cysteine protease
VRYLTSHITRYLYEGPVSQCLSEARLIPRTMPGQRVLQSKIIVEPEPAVMEQRKDYFGNDVSSFAIFRNHDRFTTTATGVVEVDAPGESPAMSSTLTWEEVRETVHSHADDECLAAYEYCFDSPYVSTSREFANYAGDTFAPSRPYAEAAAELSHRIYKEFTYLPKSTTIDMPLIEIYRNRAGVCQDFSHIMIGVLRSLGLPARYVSGYLRSGAEYQGAEASHAWVAVFVPGSGWLAFDPTNDMIPRDGHVTVAWGRDYGDVTPVKGIALGGGEQTVQVEVRVTPFEEPGTQNQRQNQSRG